MAESTTQLGERIARLEALQKTAADRAAEDRADMKQRFEVASQEMRSEIAEVRTDVKANGQAVSALQETIKSYGDQVKGALTMMGAFKALFAVTATMIVALFGFAISNAGAILKFLQAPPPR